MDSYTKECIEGFKSKIYSKDSFDGSFDEYDVFYPFTNEYISDYLRYVSFDGKNYALSVMSSGDHIFNLITSGIMNIDTFDINKITEYYVLGLKRTLILKYSYEDFIKIYNLIASQIDISTLNNDKSKSIDDDIFRQLVLDLKNEMDEKYRTFWQYLIDDKNINFSGKYISGIIMYPIYLGYTKKNNYLNCEAMYNLLKNRLGKANISFTYSDASNIVNIFDKCKYDVIMLSNVLDYMSNSFGNGWNYDSFNNYTKKLESLCRNDAIIFLHYIMACRYGAVSYNYRPVFIGSTVHLNHLGEYKFMPVENIIPDKNEGIILKKVIRN